MGAIGTGSEVVEQNRKRPRDGRYVTMAVLVTFVIAVYAYTYWSRIGT